MSTGPKQRPNTTPRGGARPGAGRKAIFEISSGELKGLFKALKKKAKETGKTWQDLFIEHLYTPSDWREGAAYHKMLTEHIRVQKSERHVEITKHEGPAIYLPEEAPDPAKVVPFRKAG